MLSIKTWTSASEAASYYAKSAKIEYYASEEAGFWRGSEALDISSNSRVNALDFQKILEGFHPKTHKALLQNSGKKHRAGYDLTFSPPKSVSLLWALGSKSTSNLVLDAHNKAVDQALNHLDKYAAITRRGKMGHRREAVKNLICAKFTHSISRENDPQLHTHTLIANLAQRYDGSWGSIDSKFIYDEKMTLGAVYRSELIDNLKKSLNVEIERKGKSFELKGIDEKTIKHFSKRRQQIEKVSKEQGFESPKALDIATLNTRQKKEKKSLDILRKEWTKKAQELGFNEKLVTGQSFKIQENPSLETIENAFQSLTENASTFTERQIRQIIATEAQGVFGRDGIEKSLEMLRDHKDIIHLGPGLDGHDRYTTSEIYHLEKSMYEKAISRLGEEKHKVSSDIFHNILEKKSTLREEQERMVRAITLEPGGIKIAMGGAGSGKSYALSAASEIWKKSGYHVLGMAPTGKASQNLEAETGVVSQTVDRFLAYDYKLSSSHIILIDEAGMMGSRKLNKILDKAHLSGSKVVLVGDSKQLQPIEAGSPTRMLREGVGSIELQKMERQQVNWQKDATRFFAEGRALDALKLYSKHNQLTSYSNPSKARKQLTCDYVDSKLKEPRKSQIVIAETNSQVQKINEEIRKALRDKGYLSKSDIKIKIRNKEKELINREFALGDRIYFTKNSKKLGVNNGTFGKITGIEKDKLSHHISVITDLDQVVTFSTRDYKDIEHGYAVTAYKSQGDTVDKSYFLVSERSSKEASYVAMSRHRENAHLYVDRSGFSQAIDWKSFPSLKQSQKKKTLEKIAIEQSSKIMSKSQEKDTSLDYKKNNRFKNELLVTKKVKDLAFKLLSTHDDEIKIDLLYNIATEHLGSPHRFKTPQLQQAHYQKTAINILRQRDFNATNALSRHILRIKEGLSVTPSKKMDIYKNSLLEEAKPLAIEAKKEVKSQKILQNQQLILNPSIKINPKKQSEKESNIKQGFSFEL